MQNETGFQDETRVHNEAGVHSFSVKLINDKFTQPLM